MVKLFSKFQIPSCLQNSTQAAVSPALTAETNLSDVDTDVEWKPHIQEDAENIIKPGDGLSHAHVAALHNSPVVLTTTFPPSNVASQAEDDFSRSFNKLGISQDVVRVLNQLSHLAPLAGPVVRAGLGVIYEILTIVSEVQAIKDLCESSSRKVIRTFHSLASAVHASGLPILPGSATALTLEPFIRELCAFRNQIRGYAELGPFKRTLRRSEIKIRLDQSNQEMNELMLIFVAQLNIVSTQRSDHERAQSQQLTPSAPRPICSSSGLAMNGSTGNSPTSSAGFVNHTQQTTPIPESIGTTAPSNSDLLNFARPSLERVSAAVYTEISWRKTLEDAKAKFNADPQSMCRPSSPSGYPLSSDESKRLICMKEQMRQMFSRGGDGADLWGIFDHRQEPITDPEDDPAQTALKLLDIISASSSLNKDSLHQLDRLRSALDDLGLFDEAAYVAQLLTDLCRRKWSEDRYPRDRANLGGALLTMMPALYRIGKSSESSQTAKEALDIFQEMASREPRMYDPMLATALSMIAADHTSAERYDEALKCSGRSIAIFKSLCQGSKEHESGLASALINHSEGLSKAGKEDESLQVVEESIAILRSLNETLAKPRRLGNQAELSRALYQQSTRLCKAGKHEEAFAASKECLQIRRALHKQLPAAYEADLARAIKNFSKRLSHQGADRQQDAFQAIEESVRMYKALHSARPAAHELFLARALRDYSTRLSEVGKHQDSLAPIEQSVKMLKALHNARPETFKEDLARALHVYSNSLNMIGKYDEALASIKQCLNIREALRKIWPAAQEAQYADTLDSYSILLSKAGADNEALDVIKESVDIYQRLCKTRPKAHGAKLAKALLTYSVQLDKAGSHQRALATSEKSLKLYKSLQKQRPSTHEAGLASALSHRSAQLSRTGQHQEALDRIEESVKMYKDLHQTLPLLYKPDLARALIDYSVRLHEMGRLREAQDNLNAGVKMYVALDQDSLAIIEADVTRALAVYLALPTSTGQNNEALTQIGQQHLGTCKVLF